MSATMTTENDTLLNTLAPFFALGFTLATVNVFCGETEHFPEGPEDLVVEEAANCLRETDGTGMLGLAAPWARCGMDMHDGYPGWRARDLFLIEMKGFGVRDADAELARAAAWLKERRHANA